MNSWRSLGVLVALLLLGGGLLSVRAAANNGIAAGLLKVDQVGSNANTNVTVTPLLLINEFLPVKNDTWNDGVNPLFPVWNTGDFYVQIGASGADDVAKGILMSSVAQNGRQNAIATNATKLVTGYAISTVTRLIPLPDLLVYHQCFRNRWERRGVERERGGRVVSL